MRKISKRPRLDPTEHPRPHIDVPMSVFGDPMFTGDYEVLGRWVHSWCYAVWKKDPYYTPWPCESDPFPSGSSITDLAIRLGWLVRDGGRLRLTGPNKDPHWLMNKRREWQTYVIEAIGQDMIKIGKSTDVERRVDELQVASPHDLRLVVVWDGDIEASLHRELHSHRVGGEWFHLNDATRSVLFGGER